MGNKERYIISDGVFKKVDEPVIQANCRGLMYGDGCFETFCAYNGSFFEACAHLNRLEEGLQYLGIAYPPDLRVKNVGSLLQHLLTKNELENQKAIIRIQVWRQGKRGYANSSSRSGYVITATAAPAVQDQYHLKTVETKRIPSTALPPKYKFTSGINYIKAANEAVDKGGDDALMETVAGHISETTIANIFWLDKNIVYTPSKECDILPGVTRRVLLDLLQKRMNMKVELGAYRVDAVKKAEAVWICNSVKEAAPVQSIDETTFNCHTSVFLELKKKLSAFISAKATDEV